MSGGTTVPRRVALISGAAGELGRALALQLCASSWAVLAVDCSAPNLEALQAAAAGLPGPLAGFVADATDPTQVEAAVAETVRLFGRLDGLANVTGGSGQERAHHPDEVSLESWDMIMSLNLRSAFLFVRSAVPVMRRQRHGRIVNFSSTLARGQHGPPTTVAGRLPYATAKAGLAGMTSQLAKDLASDGITVNAVLPGLILGDPGSRIRDRFDALPDADQASMLNVIPAGRAGTPHEVAAVAAFLLSDAAGYVSGVSLPIDGALL